MNELSLVSRRHVTSIPAALNALAAMERQFSQKQTYETLRKIVDVGQAIRLLHKDVDVIKAEAEDVILAACARIGEELERVPKAKTGPKLLTKRGKQLGGRAATMPSGTSRSRFMKLANAKTKLKLIAKKLRDNGKDATVSAVVRELTQGDKKQRRAERERELGQHQAKLTDNRYGVIYADPPWRFEPYSRNSGMDRAADNHYPTMTIDEIKAIKVPAAQDCVLFLWATVPMLPEAFEVMLTWGFTYRSHFVWVKDKIGTGYWTRNQHELLLIGTRGDIPAPSPGSQYPSIVQAEVGPHSAKPAIFAEMIEVLFPTLPRLEMFARTTKQAWDASGNELAA